MALLQEPVAEADHGLPVVAGGTELQPQPPYVGVDAASLDLVLVAPHPLDEPFADQHAARALEHVAEQLEFLVGEPDLLAAVAHDEGVELHLEVLVPIALGPLV